MGKEWGRGCLDGGGREVCFNEKVLDYRLQDKEEIGWFMEYFILVKAFSITLNPFLLILHKIVLGNKFNIVGIRISPTPTIYTFYTGLPKLTIYTFYTGLPIPTIYTFYT